jgi:hypothetical protein
MPRQRLPWKAQSMRSHLLASHAGDSQGHVRMRERHGREWQPEEAQALKEAIESRQSIANVALALGRSGRAIRIRARRLGVMPAPELDTIALP